MKQFLMLIPLLLLLQTAFTQVPDTIRAFPGDVVSLKVYVPSSFGCPNTPGEGPFTRITVNTNTIIDFQVYFQDTIPFHLPSFSTGDMLRVIHTKCDGVDTLISSYYLIKTGAPVATDTPVICMLTIDSSNHNVIVFDNAGLTTHDTILLLREGFNRYDTIAEIPANFSLVYVDSTSDARSKVYNYRAVRKGYPYGSGTIAANVYLSYSFGQLAWTFGGAADALSLDGWYVTRIRNNVRDTIGTVGILSLPLVFTDVNYQTGDTYQILASKITPCDATGVQKASDWSDGLIVSNKIQPGVTGIANTIANDLLKLQSQTGILSCSVSELALVQVFDLSGKLVMSERKTGAFTLNLSSGMYIVRAKSETKEVVLKAIVF